jgi:hypothetical protein
LSVDALDVELDDCAERPCPKDWANVKPQQRFVIEVALGAESRLSCRCEPLVQVLIKTDRRRTGGDSRSRVLAAFRSGRFALRGTSLEQFCCGIFVFTFPDRRRGRRERAMCANRAK